MSKETFLNISTKSTSTEKQKPLNSSTLVIGPQGVKLNNTFVANKMSSPEIGNPVIKYNFDANLGKEMNLGINLEVPSANFVENNGNPSFGANLDLDGNSVEIEIYDKKQLKSIFSRCEQGRTDQTRFDR